MLLLCSLSPGGSVFIGIWKSLNVYIMSMKLLEGRDGARGGKWKESMYRLALL